MESLFSGYPLPRLARIFFTLSILLPTSLLSWPEILSFPLEPQCLLASLTSRYLTADLSPSLVPNQLRSLKLQSFLFLHQKSEELHHIPYFLEMPDPIFSTRVFLKMCPEHKTRKLQKSFDFTLFLPVSIC